MRVAMITHSFYESDNRVLRYAGALAERGDTVEVAALRRNPNQAQEEVVQGVRVFRIQDRLDKNESSKLSLLGALLRFFIVSSFWITRRHWKEPYDLIHVHNIPDFLVFAAWYPRLRGARIILDIHDLVPEFFASKFSSGERSTVVRGLRVAEKLSAAFAHHIIIANHLWLDRYASRSASPHKCTVFINNVDTRLFRERPSRSAGGPPVIVFPGGLQWHQGVDIAIRAFAILRNRLPQAVFNIYGDGHMRTQLIALAKQLELDGSVRFFDPVPIAQVAAVMADATLGVVPKRADSFGNEAYSTKIMEFMAVGVPVVVSATKVDRFYFNESVVVFFESGNVEALAGAMYKVLSDDTLREDLIKRAIEYAKRNSWGECKADYLHLVDALVRPEAKAA